MVEAPRELGQEKGEPAAHPLKGRAHGNSAESALTSPPSRGKAALVTECCPGLCPLRTTWQGTEQGWGGRAGWLWLAPPTPTP